MGTVRATHNSSTILCFCIRKCLGQGFQDPYPIPQFLHTLHTLLYPLIPSSPFHFVFGVISSLRYVNVLSDETTCDPGSIIAMAGMLGYQACGVEVWELDVAVKPTVHVGRGYSCGQVSSKGDEMFSKETGKYFCKTIHRSHCPLFMFFFLNKKMPTHCVACCPCLFLDFVALLS